MFYISMTYVHSLIFLVMNLLLRTVFNFNLNSCARVTMLHTFAAVLLLSRFSCVRLCATLWTAAHQGSSVHGIHQARILEWVVIPFFWASSPPRDQVHISYISCVGRQVLYHLSHQESPNLSLLLFNHG